MFLLSLAILPLVFAAPNTHIIDGTDVTDATKHPWQGSLGTGGSHSCGCVLLSETWVLTAAHCVPVGSGDRFTVRFGSTQLGEGTLYEISNATQHEHFRDQSYSGAYPNDIALLKADTAIPLSDTVQPLRLDNEQSTEGCMITGWGVTETGPLPSPLPTTLQEAAISVLTDEQATDAWGEEYNGDLHICVHDLEDYSSGACNGDSGGPLYCIASDGAPELRGVTSWGVSGCNTAFPSTYTRVHTFKDWICTNTGGDICQ